MPDVDVTVAVQGAKEAAGQIDELNKSIEKTGQAAEKTTQQGQATKGWLDLIKQGAGTAAEGMTALEFATLGAGAAVGVLGGYAVKAAYDKLKEYVGVVSELGDKFNDLSQITGVSVEALSGKLRLAAETSGSSVEGLAHGIVQLNKSMSAAATETGPAYDAFQRLGISLDTIKKSTPEEMLSILADKFANAEDGATKTEIAMTLMGRAGSQLIPTLNNGADGLARLEREARLAGLTMSGETAKAADELNDNLRILKAYSEGFWMGVASPIVEGLAKITGAMRDAAGEGAGFFGKMYAGAQKLAELGMIKVGILSSPQGDLKAAQADLVKYANIMNDPSASAQSKAWAQQEYTARAGSLQGLVDAVSLDSQWNSSSGFLTGQEKGKLAGKSPKEGAAGPTPEQLAARDIAASEKLASNYLAEGTIDKETYLQFLNDLAEAYKEFEDLRSGVAAKAAKLREQMQKEEHDLILLGLKNETIAREKKDAEEQAAFKQKMKDKEDALKKEQHAQAEAAAVDLKVIEQTTFLFREQKLAALEELRQKYEDMKEAGVEALKKINHEMAITRDTTRQTNVVVNDMGFNLGAVFKGVYNSLQSTIAESTKWLLGMSSQIHNLGDAMKSFLGGVANSIINEFSRIAANEVFRWLFGSGGGTSINVSGGGGGGASGGILSSVLGNIVGSGASSFLSNFGGSALTGFGSLFQDAGVSLGIQGIADIGNFFNAWGGEGIGSALEMFGLGDLVFPGFGTVLSLLGGSGALDGVINVVGDVLGGIGDAIGSIFGGLFPTGTDMTVTSPTMFIAGDAGPERVTVSPMSGAAHGHLRGGGGGVTIQVQGMSLMDNYAATRFGYELRRVQKGY